MTLLTQTALFTLQSKVHGSFVCPQVKNSPLEATSSFGPPELHFPGFFLCTSPNCLSATNTSILQAAIKVHFLLKELNVLQTSSKTPVEIMATIHSLKLASIISNSVQFPLKDNPTPEEALFYAELQVLKNKAFSQFCEFLQTPSLRYEATKTLFINDQKARTALVAELDTNYNHLDIVNWLRIRSLDYAALAYNMSFLEQDISDFEISLEQHLSIEDSYDLVPILLTNCDIKAIRPALFTVALAPWLIRYAPTAFLLAVPRSFLDDYTNTLGPFLPTSSIPFTLTTKYSKLSPFFADAFMQFLNYGLAPADAEILAKTSS